MNLLHTLSLLAGGAFLMNAIPHLVSGVLGRPFQSPFARPPGEGLSSSTVNVLWGFANLVLAYLLLIRFGSVQWDGATDVAAAGFGAFAIALFSARHFGRFHGGNALERQ
ncbi:MULTISPECIES: hypothetical protein [unclassified Rhizobium]|uniref:hypothetical protein n=1 Tax=unclassified Rhizobium TaxID=2613769 RepID=UPI000BA8818D|nr:MULTISPECIES: hypothetical protein [unclassified Rhizobium]ASW09862.1 hypothetical protein CKA34_27955 [Rhizobium sp. 11515TR]MDK4715975.1 hypothetical protein [Rhizobium sp. CNPSo 4039]